jgi:BCD family chlorophyll transporter-like MFS transporter
MNSAVHSVREELMIAAEKGKLFTLGRALRLSSFQIGSAMGDILVTSIWNRVMISNFGIPAAPVSLLIALRYLLSPLSLYAGYLTDNHTFWGLRRTPVIWLGRGLMVLSLPLLGLSLLRLGDNSADLLGWIVATSSSLLYGIGTLISGSPFLALARDSAPPEKQGVAISLVETVLIIFFAIVGIGFSVWMEVYDERIFWEMVLATMVIGGFFWVFAIIGVEKRQKLEDDAAITTTQYSLLQRDNLRLVLRTIWQDGRTRRFFLFLSLATMAAWTQDAILEPFGADVFQLEVSRTTRLNSYWQAATVVTLVVSAVLLRHRPPEQQGRLTAIGLTTMAMGMALLAGASLSNQVHLIEIALLLFGAGFGIYTFGGLSLMAVMSPDRHAGAYLGLWTISILVFKGLGTFAGGFLRDLFLLAFGLPETVAYGLVFLFASAGLATAVLLLQRIDILGFARDNGRTLTRTEVQVASAD